MKTYIVCDGGCGTQSPNPKNDHEANHWLRVRSGANTGFDRLSPFNDKIFCDSCSVPIRQALEGGKGR